MARNRISDRLSGDSALSLVPSSGSLPPFSKTPLTLTYAPALPENSQPFAAQIDPAKLHVSQNFRINLSYAPFGQHAKLQVKARAVFPGVVLNPPEVFFGHVETGASAEELCYVANKSDLPVRVDVVRAVMYCHVEPTRVQVAAGATAMLKVKYAPRGMGKHVGRVDLSVLDEAGTLVKQLSLGVEGAALRESKRGRCRSFRAYCLGSVCCYFL